MLARKSVGEDDSFRAGSNGSMGFLEHLDELRTRLIRSCVAVAAGMAATYAFADRVAAFILGPTVAIMASGTQLQMTRPGEGFAFYLDISLMGGGLLASPYVLFQVWRFIAPGLYANEKRLAVPFVVMGVIGTVTGAAFSHYLLFPSMMGFFASFDSPFMRWTPTVQDTFAQYKHMLLAMVLVFQLPTVVFFLARMRLVTARWLWKQFRYAVLITFTAAAVLTPSPDPWTQLLLAAPMLAMYVLSIGIAWCGTPRGGRRDAARHVSLVVAAAVVDKAARSRIVQGAFGRQRRRTTRERRQPLSSR
jgi:sec-independent protein translocase protein TatC